VSAPHRHAQRCFGVLGEYASAPELLARSRTASGHGFTKMEALHADPDARRVARASGTENDLPQYVLAGGILGAMVGFGMQYYASVHHYPVNVGGRPLNSWPSFIPSRSSSRSCSRR
jgi:hypothetical protein